MVAPLYLVLPAIAASSASAFQQTAPPSLLQQRRSTTSLPPQQQQLSPDSINRWHHQTIALFANSNDKDEQPQEGMDNTTNDPLNRFLSPQIDDPGLPLTDILFAQIVAPTLQLYWVFITQSPLPSWATPISSYFGEAAELAPRGSLLAPTLIHGAGLAVCWLAGALAAKSFERDAFTLSNNNFDDDGSNNRLSMGGKIKQYDTVLLRLFQAGAFACGILIVSTQVDLLLEFKGQYVSFGESEETDFRLFLASVEVINDIVFEALVISSWRTIHANFMSTPSNRVRRF
jgi:hypothetical protein